ncbi:MAG: EamA-like transporter family protein [Rhodobacteraceae bacterium]|nr:MAG: EamA-like transporter family protein [Paracoccaceae bacterium]
MTAGVTLGVLVAAGAALVAQNLLMAKITGAASNVLVALLMNSAVGLALLSALLLRKVGLNGLGEIAETFRLWFVIPGLLGTFFVYASVTGYQTVGAAPTIAILVSSQLVFGLAYDISRSEALTGEGFISAIVGAVLLVAGAILILSRFR